MYEKAQRATFGKISASIYFRFFFRTINMAQTRTAMKSGSYGWTMWRMVNMSFLSSF